MKMIKSKKVMKRILLVFFFTALFNSVNCISAEISGDLVPWHKVVITFTGPNTSETAVPNPFTDYRLDVLFTGPSGQTFKVPGFYTADGNAGETSSGSGNIWQTNFSANEVGEWTYEATFVSGVNIAAELTGGTSAGFFDGETGNFTISENTNTNPKDFFNKGKLTYVNNHFLQFQGSGEYYIKGGANSPEVFLEFAEFDNTDSERTYPDHIADWRDGDPVWKENKGKGIIGAVNYLSSLDVNGYYFLTMNAYGDGKKAWPWLHKDSIIRYDCSKLDQWDVVFKHMNAQGIMVHFVLTETENEAYFEIRDNGDASGFAMSRKIYYREMVARFGYLPAVTWNIGEENGWAEGDGFHIANTNQQRKDFSDRLRELTYYDDHISIHNGPSTDDYILDDLLGHQSITGPSFQWDFGKNIYSKISEWRNKSIEAGHKWVMNLDEPYINPATGNLDLWRTENVWATYMAGGAGIELYIGAGIDVNAQNFRLYEEYYKTMTNATNFISKYLPFNELTPDTEFSDKSWTLRKNDELFLFYLHNAEDFTLDMPQQFYKIQWYNPRESGAPVFGSTHYIDGDNNTNMGIPPYDAEKDWVCLVTEADKNNPLIDITNSVIDKEIEEKNLELSLADTIQINNAGDGILETLNIDIENGSWLNVELNSFSENNQQYILTINENANNLPIGKYSAVITFSSDNTNATFAICNLTVNYNLNGHKYAYSDNGMIIMEIESADIKTNWIKSTENEGFSGNGYYYYNGPINSETGVDDNAFQYYFYLPKSGTYQMGIRNFVPNADYTEDNDSWIKMDDDRWWKHFSHTNLKWNWETGLDDGDENFHDPIWDLDAGFHVLQIDGRSMNFCLDKIHLYDTKIKEQFYLDTDLLPSAVSDRKQPIISLPKNYYIYNQKEGKITAINSKNLNIENAGINILEGITADASNDLITPIVSGEGNNQVLNLNFNDKILDLSAGVHNCSITLNCENASSREIKIYFNVEQQTGIFDNTNDLKIRLKSNIVNSSLEFIGDYNDEIKVSIINLNGQLVYSKIHTNISSSRINTSFFAQGFYTIRLQSKTGIYNQKFVIQQ